MISLKQISTIDYIENYLTKEERELMRQLGIDNYELLGNFILNNPSWKFSKTHDHYFFVEGRVNEIGKDLEAELYDIPEYSDKTLEYNDKLVYGSSLILVNPTTTAKGLVGALTNITVAEIKHRARHLTVYFKNALDAYDSLNPIRAKKAVSGVLLYHDQIERQGLEVGLRNTNLFTYKLDERKKLVEKQIRDIIVYLIESTDKGFVWGELTEVQKKKYLMAVSRDFKPDILIRESLIDMIASHITLAEASEDLTKGDTLNRFMLK